jgi:hypothetical protein
MRSSGRSDAELVTEMVFLHSAFRHFRRFATRMRASRHSLFKPVAPPTRLQSRTSGFCYLACRRLRRRSCVCCCLRSSLYPLMMWLAHFDAYWMCVSCRCRAIVSRLNALFCTGWRWRVSGHVCRGDCGRAASHRGIRRSAAQEGTHPWPSQPCKVLNWLFGTGHGCLLCVLFARAARSFHS